jgi:hypothetical protein
MTLRVDVAPVDIAMGARGPARTSGNSPIGAAIYRCLVAQWPQDKDRPMNLWRLRNEIIRGMRGGLLAKARAWTARWDRGEAVEPWGFEVEV